MRIRYLVLVVVMAMVATAVVFFAAPDISNTMSRVGATDESSSIEFHAQHVVGSELRVIVETYRSWYPPLSRRGRAAEGYGYLVIIDLASDQPLTDRTTIYGPLWDLPGPLTYVDYLDGTNYSPEAEAAGIPFFTFDADGTVLRFKRDTRRNTVVRDALVLTPANGSWVRQGDVQPIQSGMMPGSENRVETRSEQYVMLFRNGEAKLFNYFTGQPIDDEWLTQSFAEARSIKDLNNVRLLLTDDLKHLVISPMAIWNKGGSGGILKQFDFEGKTYNRGDVGLAYSRPAQRPVLFNRHVDEKVDFLGQPPHGAVSIDGELYLFSSDDSQLRLYTPDGQKEMIARSSPDMIWDSASSPQFQHVEAEHELVLLNFYELSLTARDFDTLEVLRWNYATGQLTRAKANIREIFKEKSGKLYPVSLLPIVD